ncbi:substrate-binding periplasmic protein [Ampullimonas aquatilis]|uniref:substrate-binding periplasmic protein n=1 Tax=Ampullimonas aquatilis TaxID=1341549 RepID=UPI003C75B26C
MKKLLIVLTLLEATGIAHAATLDDIVQRGSLNVCLDPDGLPYSSESASSPGFLIDLSKKLAQDMGVRFNPIWLGSRERLSRTECDVVPNAIVSKAKLNEQKDDLQPGKVSPTLLTQPYFHQQVLLVSQPKGQSWQTLADLQKISVAVPSATWGHMQLNTYHVPVLVRFLTDEAIVKAVADGEAEAGIVSATGYSWYSKTYSQKFQTQRDIIKELDLEFDVGMTLRKTDVAMLNKIDGLLASYQISGVFAELMKPYGLIWIKPSF